MTTAEHHSLIINSSIFRLNGPPVDLCRSLIALVASIKAEPDTDWSIGEHTEASLDNLVVGAYWALVEWHAGQESISYAALCALGTIFKPGSSTQPDKKDAEFSAYNLICKHFEQGGTQL